MLQQRTGTLEFRFFFYISRYSFDNRKTYMYNPLSWKITRTTMVLALNPNIQLQKQSLKKLQGRN